MVAPLESSRVQNSPEVDWSDIPFYVLPYPREPLYQDGAEAFSVHEITILSHQTTSLLSLL